MTNEGELNELPRVRRRVGFREKRRPACETAFLRQRAQLPAAMPDIEPEEKVRTPCCILRSSDLMPRAMRLIFIACPTAAASTRRAPMASAPV